MRHDMSHVTKVEKIKMRLDGPVARMEGKSEALKRGTACGGEA